MAEQHAAFVGTVPPNYDRYLGPLLFHPYADDLAARLPVARGTRVLEVACGTGIVTERLVRRLAGQGTLVATDLNDAMIAHARARIPADPALEWRQADGTASPSPTAPSTWWCASSGSCSSRTRPRACGRRSGSSGRAGCISSTCGTRDERNAAARIAHDTIRAFFPDDPPQFYQVPFSLHDTAAVRGLLDAAGFADVASETVDRVGTSPSAADAATGLVEGNPVIGTIMERRPDALPDIKAAVARNIAAELGDHPVRAPLRAHVFTARRPG